MHPSNSRNAPARSPMPSLPRSVKMGDPRARSIEAEFRLNEIAPVAEQIFVRSAQVAENLQAVAVELGGGIQELEQLHLESMVEEKFKFGKVTPK